MTLLYNISSTGIYVNWEHIPKEFVNGHLLGYQIFYQVADATESSEWFNKTVAATENGTTITDLRKFTNYAVQVAGFTGVGTGIESKAKFVTTDEDGMSLFILNHYNVDKQMRKLQKLHWTLKKSLLQSLYTERRESES